MTRYMRACFVYIDILFLRCFCAALRCSVLFCDALYCSAMLCVAAGASVVFGYILSPVPFLGQLKGWIVTIIYYIINYNKTTKRRIIIQLILNNYVTNPSTTSVLLTFVERIRTLEYLVLR
ncbi:hypothetical protein F5Y02DRAFT_222456 [Annulohypoxylon stygium]|nr:hypothetical protein F5Y02DRAFT_222456 [Annulohypoxylon stygium]